MRRLPALGATLLGASAAPLAAQIPELPTITENWTEASYPKLFWTSRDGFTLGLYYGQIEPMGWGEEDEPERYHAALSLDGQISSSGRKQLAVEGHFPKLLDGWRLHLVFNGYRRPRDFYFGIGNATNYTSDSVTAAQEHFYDADRRTILLRGEVQRDVVAGVRALAGFNVQRWRLDAPDGPSVLARDQAAGVVPSASVNDAYLRFGLVFDTRDDEVAPRGGFLLEVIHGIADSGLAGSASYTRTTGSATAYLQLGAKTVVAARAVGQRMGGDPPVPSWYLIEASDDPYEGLGGANSHRAFQDLRFLGRHKLFGSLDVRYDLLYVETLVQLTLLGFLDAGRVFEGQDFRLTTEGLHVGGGAGLFLRWGRNAVLGMTGGGSADGFVIHVNTRWAY